MLRQNIQFILVLMFIGVTGYNLGVEKVQKEIIKEHKLNRFYISGEGAFRVECNAIEQETITRDKEL